MSPFSSIIFTSASDAISVEITHGSNDETDIYLAKKEYPCRGELKPLLPKVMASSSSASQDASIRQVNVVVHRHIRTYTASEFTPFAPRSRQFIVEFIESVLLEFGGDRLGG